MSEQNLFDLYVDYLMVSTGQVSATGLAALLDDTFSHDKVTRMLSQSPDLFSPAHYWKRVKPIVRQVGAEEGVLIVDDFVVDKPHSSENELITYHHSHLHGGTVKGINIVHLQYSVPYQEQTINLPVGFEVVCKTATRMNEQTGKEEQYSPVSKNEMARDLLHQAHFMHHVPFSWVLADTWRPPLRYGNAPNIKYVVQKLKKDVLFGMKSNRNIALSKGQARRKEFVKLADIALQPGQVQEIWLDRVPFPLYVAKEVYVNAGHPMPIIVRENCFW